MASRLFLVGIAVVLLLVAGAAAEENLTVNITAGGSVAVVEYEPEPVLPPAPYINQGDTIYVGDYVDISGVTPPYRFLAYWDGFDMYDTYPSYNVTLPNGKRGYYRFYVDPDIFESRTGRWYKYDGKFERQGNNVAFIVKRKQTDNSTMTYPNGTVVNVSTIQNVTYEQHIIKPDPLLPEKHIADYVVAKGDEIIWPDGGYHLWVLGQTSGIYDNPNGNVTKKQVESLVNGDYTVVVHVPGNDTQYDARYGNKELIPYRYGYKPVSVDGLQPYMVYDRLKGMLIGTDDKLYEYNLQVDVPTITINRADEMYLKNRTVLDVRGYTNAANGTEITVSLDERNTYYKLMPERTAKTTAIRTSPGNLSYYRAYVPIDWDELAADATNHTLTARTAIGGVVQKDFKVSVMPADSFKPNASIKYIEDRNPFVPTPTPEVVTVVKTQVVVQTITVPVTPSHEVVEAAQRKATEEVALNYVYIIGSLIVCLLLVIGVVWYGVRVYRRL